MSRDPPTTGTYLTIYLAGPLLGHIEEQAELEGMGLPGWIRERLIDICPPYVQAATRRATRPQKDRTMSSEKKPKKEDPPAAPTFDELVEKNRQKVLDLDAKGYSSSAIGGVLRIPYRVVAECLYTKVKPKKGDPK